MWILLGVTYAVDAENLRCRHISNQFELEAIYNDPIVATDRRAVKTRIANLLCATHKWSRWQTE
jgi:hypothetical protein